MKRIIVAALVAAGLSLSIAAPSQAHPTPSHRDTTWGCPTC